MTKINEIEKLICANTQDEGFGSVYERIALERLLRRLYKKYRFKSVLEYECESTKGYDNLALIEEGCRASVASQDINKIKKNWKFKIKPDFESMNINKKFDLVWNFAVVQLRPGIIQEMKKTSNQFVLFFTPNIWNYGTPFHLIYHWLSGTKCHHAERGRIILRRKRGLEKIARLNGLKIIESGYVDIPWWPDTAFSIKEFKKNLLGIKVKDQKKAKQNAKELLQKIEKMMFIEKSTLIGFLKPLFAHHTYVLARIK